MSDYWGPGFTTVPIIIHQRHCIVTLIAHPHISFSSLHFRLFLVLSPSLSLSLSRHSVPRSLSLPTLSQGLSLSLSLSRSLSLALATLSPGLSLSLLCPRVSLSLPLRPSASGLQVFDDRQIVVIRLLVLF